MARTDIAPRGMLTELRPLFDWPETMFTDMMRTFAERIEPYAIHVEEFVEDGSMVIRAELPGIDPDKDVEIIVKDGLLTLRAQRKETTKADTTTGYRSEFRYGEFMRTITLPLGTVEEDVKATYHDGILEVRLPMPTETPIRKIAVQRT